MGFFGVPNQHLEPAACSTYSMLGFAMEPEATFPRLGHSKERRFASGYLLSSSTVSLVQKVHIAPTTVG